MDCETRSHAGGQQRFSQRGSRCLKCSRTFSETYEHQAPCENTIDLTVDRICRGIIPSLVLPQSSNEIVDLLWGGSLYLLHHHRRGNGLMHVSGTDLFHRPCLEHRFQRWSQDATKVSDRGEPDSCLDHTVQEKFSNLMGVLAWWSSQVAWTRLWRVIVRLQGSLTREKLVK